MKIKRALQALFFFAALAALAGPARAGLIANGGFDSDALGWTWTHIDGAGGWRSTGGNPGGMFILNSNGASGTDPTIEQLVTGLITGDPYQLTGDYRHIYGSYGSHGPDTFAVDVGAVEHLFDFPGDGQWGSFLVDFNAPGEQVLIRFRAEINGDDTDYAVDNIALVHLSDDGPAPVPLPGVLLLLGAGLLALGATRRR